MNACKLFLLRSLTVTAFFLVLLAFQGCGNKDFQYDYFTVDRALSGNQLLLVNGYTVTLIGVEDNAITREYLSREMPNHKVRFFFDSKSPLYQISPYDPDKLFYAYVLLDNGTCLNSFLLKNQYSIIPQGEYYLNDSLTQYLAYTNQNSVVPGEDRTFTSDPKEIPHYTGDESPPVNPMEGRLMIEGCEDLMEMILPACDYNHPVVRDLGVSVAGLAQGNFNIGQVCEIFRESRTRWKYVNDPKGMEYFAKASETISRAQFSGDCDDYSILLYSLLTAIGGDARIVFAWGPTGGHAFAEIDITDMNFNEIKREIINRFSQYAIESINYQVDAEGRKWLNLDWWAAHPGGKYLDYNTYMTFYPRQNRCFQSQ